MSYNLFLDDVRDPNKFLQSIKTWVIARDYNQFVNIITERGLPEFISFDHDLAFEHYPFNDPNQDGKTISYNVYTEKTGYHCAQWLINYCLDKAQKLPPFQVHSMNPVGRENIKQLLHGFQRHQSSQ